MSQRNQARHRDSQFFNGPPICHCPTYNKMIEDAITGSTRLLMAIEKAGVRP